METVTCSDCKIAKPISEFTSQSLTKGGKRCKPCATIFRREQNKKQKEKEKIIKESGESFECSKCEKIKEASLFKSVLTAKKVCIECAKAGQKSNAERVKEHNKVNTETKMCSKCIKKKPRADFNLVKNTEEAPGLCIGCREATRKGRTIVSKRAEEKVKAEEEYNKQKFDDDYLVYCSCCSEEIRLGDLEVNTMLKLICKNCAKIPMTNNKNMLRKIRRLNALRFNKQNPEVHMCDVCFFIKGISHFKGVRGSITNRCEVCRNLPPIKDDMRECEECNKTKSVNDFCKEKPTQCVVCYREWCKIKNKEKYEKAGERAKAKEPLSEAEIKLEKILENYTGTRRERIQQASDDFDVEGFSMCRKCGFIGNTDEEFTTKNDIVLRYCLKKCHVIRVEADGKRTKEQLMTKEKKRYEKFVRFIKELREENVDPEIYIYGGRDCEDRYQPLSEFLNHDLNVLNNCSRCREKNRPKDIKSKQAIRNDPTRWENTLERQRLHRENNPEQYEEYNRRRRVNALCRVKNIMKKADKRGIKFNLNIDYAMKLCYRNCKYCQVEVDNEFINGIDRVDSFLGYVKGNVVACCRACNISKGSADLGDFIKRCIHIVSYLELCDKVPNDLRFPDSFYNDLYKNLDKDSQYSYNRYIRGVKDRAKDISFEISEELYYNILEKKCFYCGQIEFKYHNKISIDRLDSNLGYTQENCVPCCSCCNFLKNDSDLKEYYSRLVRIATKYIKHE